MRPGQTECYKDGDGYQPITDYNQSDQFIKWQPQRKMWDQLTPEEQQAARDKGRTAELPGNDQPVPTPAAPNEGEAAAIRKHGS